MSIILVFLLFISTHGSYQRNIFRAYGDLYGLGVQDLSILAGNPQTNVEKRIGAILLISGLSVMDDQLATRHKFLEMLEESKDCPREVHAASKVAQTILKAVEIRGTLTKGMKPWNLFPVSSRDLMAMEYYTQRIAVEILLGNTKDLETCVKF